MKKTMGGDVMEDKLEFKKMPKEAKPVFENILEKIWSYNEYTDNEVIRNAFIKTDVHRSLFESDYKEVAYVNGELAGVAFARTSSLKSSLNVYDYVMYVYYALKLKVYSKESRKLLKHFKNMYKAYKTLDKQKSKTLKIELILFMVNPVYQRKGLGKKLIERFEKRLRQKGKSHYYLFTDSQCTVAFYDANGYHLEGETTIQEPLKDGTRALKIMLYSKALKGSE